MLEAHSKKLDPLAELLFKAYRRQVLALLLLRPDQHYHVREIARLTGTVAGTLHKELNKLAAVGILLKTEEGTHVQYQANTECIIFNELASIFRKTSGVADVLYEYLAPLSDAIQTALVFGSIASGKAHNHSDVDLLIISDTLNYGELVKALYPAQTALGREVNPKLYTITGWHTVQQESSVFTQEILTKPVIEIIGTQNDLR